jgi:hypothetical protein
MYKNRTIKYMNKLSCLSGGSYCQCGRIANPTHGTCCRACALNINQHTKQCDQKNSNTNLATAQITQSSILQIQKRIEALEKYKQCVNTCSQILQPQQQAQQQQAQQQQAQQQQQQQIITKCQCGRDINPNLPNGICCDHCQKTNGLNHTKKCEQQYLKQNQAIQAVQPKQQKRVASAKIGKSTGGKSITLTDLNFNHNVKTGFTTPHFEYYKANTSRLPPNMNSGNILYAGDTYLSRNAIMRPLFYDAKLTREVFREDGYQAHVTVYYGVDAKNQMVNFMPPNDL